MKVIKIMGAGLAMLLLPAGMKAQSAFDAYTAAQTDLRGSARFMSMAGAFGALGGDLSVLNQNPGGIGVYRSSDIGATMSWNIQKTQTGNGVDRQSLKETNFNFDNVGYIGTLRTGMEALPTINWGFTYNKTASFDRRYSGVFSNLPGSMTNFVASQTNAGLWNADDLGAVEGGYNPYRDPNVNAPWMSILAYNSFLINPNQDGRDFKGLYKNGTTGMGEFEMQERGGIDEYSISFGGNAYDKVYWGMSVGITDFDYNLYAYYGEALDNAYVPYESTRGGIALNNGYASWGMENFFRMHGTGVNFKMGLIVKPINEFRIGFAFHTPTFYSMKSEYTANTSFLFEADSRVPDVISDIDGTAFTDEGYVGETWFDMQSPWKFMLSAAAVVGGRGILSFDYERNVYPTMRVSYDGYEDIDVTNHIKSYYKASDIFRLGGEFKVTPQFSLRAGYSLQTSPVKSELMEDRMNVATAGTTLSYSLDDKIQYITAGVGYRYKAFYLDMAFVHKDRKSEYHAFSPEVSGPASPQLLSVSPAAAVRDKNNEIVLTIGFKF